MVPSRRSRRAEPLELYRRCRRSFPRRSGEARARAPRRDPGSANAADYEAAAGTAGRGDARQAAAGRRTDRGAREQVEAVAAIDPLEREIDSWTLPNGLQVSERRIPIGVVGANFEARPNVALDVAGQLLKSLNTAVLRTGGAALRTVTVSSTTCSGRRSREPGLPPAAVGLVRSPEREGARVLVTMPERIPLVILRGSGETTAQLAQLAAEHGVRTLAHAEGGGVLYVHSEADRDRALDDDGGDARPARRVQPAQPCARRSRGRRAAARPARDLRARRASTCAERSGQSRPRATESSRTTETGSATSGRTRPERDRDGDARRRRRPGRRAPDRQRGDIRARGRNRDRGRSGSESVPRRLPGHGGVLARDTRFTDGFELTGSPETGINVDKVPGPRGPVTYKDLWLRQYRVIGDGTQTR